VNTDHTYTIADTLPDPQAATTSDSDTTALRHSSEMPPFSCIITWIVILVATLIFCPEVVIVLALWATSGAALSVFQEYQAKKMP
jgi:hypothetical protein